ncbi:hypothetical protein ACX80U_09595 [Arthrobacter sp. TmT3-37]
MKLPQAISRFTSWSRLVFPSRFQKGTLADSPALDADLELSSRAKEHRITVFLDEGALDGDARFPSACAVVVGNVASVEAAIEKEMHNLLLRPDFRLEPSAKKFEKIGFHHVDDNVIAKQAFLNLLPRLDFDWWCSSNLHPSEDSYETLSDQFEWLIEKILQKLKTGNVHFIFEQNGRLDSQFPLIVETAVRNANYNPDSVCHSIGTKRDRSLAIADYCIAVATQATAVWMTACCEVAKARKRHPYRTFVRIEPLCSVLYSWDIKKSISSRSDRLGDQSYFELTGRHHPDCSHAGTSEVSS